VSGHTNGRTIEQEKVFSETVEITATIHTLIHENELDRLPPLSWLIEDFLPEGKLCVLFGSPGVGKSFVALDMGLQVAQEYPVVYVAAEGFAGYAKRKNAWYTHHKKASGNMFFSADPLILMNSQNVDAFITTVNQVKPKLIILDTLAWCMTGGDENSARDMQIVMAACRRIQQETGATILLVHHTVKRGGSERGSSALRGSADMMFELTQEEGVLTLSCSKSKDTEPFKKQYFRLMKVETNQGASCVVMPSDKVIVTPGELTTGQQEILEQLSLKIFTDVGMRSNQIIAAVTLAPSSVYKLLSQLVQKGLVRQAKKGDPFYITEKGKQALKV
jgi:predicted transcriptional regulator